MNCRRCNVMKVTVPLLLLFFTNFSSVLGFAVIPPFGITARTLRFTVSGFTVPVQMAYTTDQAVKAEVPFISQSKEAAMKFIDGIVKEAIEAIFMQEGNLYFIHPLIISAILREITTTITYKPLQCNKVLVDKDPAVVLNYDPMKKENCFIKSGTVTALCTAANCAIAPAGNRAVVSVPDQYHTLTGTLRTTNMFMLTWPDQKWRDIFGRVQRFLREGRYAQNFFGRWVRTHWSIYKTNHDEREITTTITYKLLQCNKVLVDKDPATVLDYDQAKKENCFIKSGTVTILWTEGPSCALQPPQGSKAAVIVPEQYRTLTGTLRTTNIFMLACLMRNGEMFSTGFNNS